MLPGSCIAVKKNLTFGTVVKCMRVTEHWVREEHDISYIPLQLSKFVNQIIFLGSPVGSMTP